MRLPTHTNWQDADKTEQQQRSVADTHVLACLTGFLASRRRCVLDEFITAYAELPQNGPGTDVPLPPRGDLVRFIRRHPQVFQYDSQEFIVTLKPVES